MSIHVYWFDKQCPYFLKKIKFQRFQQKEAITKVLVFTGQTILQNLIEWTKPILFLTYFPSTHSTLPPMLLSSLIKLCSSSWNSKIKWMLNMGPWTAHTKRRLINFKNSNTKGDQQYTRQYNKACTLYASDTSLLFWPTVINL